MNTGIKLVYISIYYHCNKNQQILFEPKTPQSPLITEFTSGGSRISPRRGRQLPRGAPTYDFAKFSQKLHEIERIWTPGGGGRVQNFTM